MKRTTIAATNTGAALACSTRGTAVLASFILPSKKPSCRRVSKLFSGYRIMTAIGRMIILVVIESTIPMARDDFYESFCIKNLCQLEFLSLFIP